jgi:hypothetical protein
MQGRFSSGALAVVALVALTPRDSLANYFTITVRGVVSSVDAPLTSEFHVGEAVRFNFGIVPELFTPNGGAGTFFAAPVATFQVGPDYSAASATPFARFDLLNNDGSFGPPFFDDIAFEKNNMTAANVNGLVLSDTYLRLGFFNGLFPDPLMDGSDILATNGEAILQQEAGLFFSATFGHEPYSHVWFDMQSVDVVGATAPPVFGLFAIGVLALLARLKRES